MRKAITAVPTVGIVLIVILALCGHALAQTPAQPPPPAQPPAQAQPAPQPPAAAQTQPTGQQMGPAAGGGTPRAGVMHRGSGVRVGQDATGQLGPIGSGLMGTLHRWAALLFSHSADINLTVPQREQIEAIFFSHLKYAIPKQAERRVMILDIEQALTRDQPDIAAVEQKVKALEALDSDMTMEGIRILQKAIGVLNDQQRATMKTLFRQSLYGQIREQAQMPREPQP